MSSSVGAIYVHGVVKFNALRRRLLLTRPRLRVLEATLFSLLLFSITFAFPFAYSCRPCTEAMTCHPSYGSGSGSGSGSAAIGRRLGGGWEAAVGRGRRLGGGGTTLEFVRWNCAAGEYNPMASLLHSGQEGLIKHLLERKSQTAAALAAAGGGSSNTSSSSGDDGALGWDVVLPFWAVYLVLAIAVFGIFVPSGNFIPALTLGAAMGRLFGMLIAMWFRHSFPDQVVDLGVYALMGAAAALTGVTRMTITIAVILTEISDDAQSILPMMVVLTCVWTQPRIRVWAGARVRTMAYRF